MTRQTKLLLLCLFSIGYFAWLAPHLVEWYRAKDYSSTLGVVLTRDIDETTNRQDGGATMHLRYRFKVDDREYEGTRYYLDGSDLRMRRLEQRSVAARFAPGSRVTIHYSTADPARCVIETTFPRTMFGVLALLAVMLGLAAYQWMRLRIELRARRESGSTLESVAPIRSTPDIAKLETLQAEARAQPEEFRWKLNLLGLLGYAPHALTFLLAAGGCAAIALGWVGAQSAALAILVGVLGSFFRSLAVSIDKPAGIVLKRRHHPELFAVIDELCLVAEAPKIDKVLIGGEFNASAFETPELGPFGDWQRHVVIGMPLALMATRDEFAACLAHEIGHLRGGHGKFVHGVHRRGMAWLRFLSAIEKREGLSARIFVGFYRWFVPRYVTRVHVLMREFERSADEVAAKAISARALVDMLTRLLLERERATKRFWIPLAAQQRTQTLPPDDLHTRMREYFARDWEHSDFEWAQSEMRAVKEAPDDPSDSHPPLRERAAAFGLEPRLPPRIEVCAADVLFGDRLDALCAQLDRSWFDAVKPKWKAAHVRWKKKEARLRALEQRAASLSAKDRAELEILQDELGMRS